MQVLLFLWADRDHIDAANSHEELLNKIKDYARKRMFAGIGTLPCV